MNISQLLTKTAKTFPNRTALVYGNKTRTYAEFNGRANRLARALNALGVRSGDNVAILQYNYAETLESLFACFKAGCGAVPINFRLHPKEFAFIIQHSQSRALIISPEFNEAVVQIRKLIPGAEFIISIKGGQGEIMDYEQVLADSATHWIDAEVAPDDLAWLFYTSGTTGKPKGAMLTHRNLLAMTMNFFADMCSLGPEDIILHAAPLSHGSGLYALPNIAKGSCNVILPDKTFNAESIFKVIENHGITNFFAAPTMVKRLVESPRLEQYNLSSLRCLIYGGGPMYARDLKNAIQKLGPCLVQLYGQAESPMTISYLPQSDHVLDGTLAQEKKLTSAGIARTDVEVAVFDENERELPPGSVGELVTRSDLVMKGYWQNPQATEDALRSGWLHTGDQGYMDQAGYVYLMDRSKDMIISGGENIYPREVEEILMRHPAVREAAVIGIPDPNWGEAVKAVIALVPGQSVSEEKLIEFCKNNIASYKKPKSVDFVEELPKNNYGKIVKRELRAKYWQDRDRRV